MEDGGLGNVLFYIILAVIGLAGSISNSKKKKGAGSSQKSFKWPDISEKSVPQQRTVAEKKQEDAARSVKASVEQARNAARTDTNTAARATMAGSFDQEGRYNNPRAEAFSGEGSLENAFASRFSNEGRYENKFAGSFAGEGISSLNDVSDFKHLDIADEQITDIEQYDYNAAEEGDERLFFDLRKAVIYSALLDRKEYTF